MLRRPDPANPAVAVQPEPGDCVADVGAEVLEEVGAYHDDAEPPDSPVNPEELV